MSEGVHFRNPACKLLYHLASTSDDSGNSKTLSNYGTVTFPSNSLGACGASALFASSGQYLSVNTSGVSLSNDFTVRFTLNISQQVGSADDTMRVLQIIDGTYYLYVVYSNTSAKGGIAFYLNTQAVNTGTLITLVVGTPYHVVVTHDSGVFSLYLNGKLLDSRSCTLLTNASNYFRISSGTADVNLHGYVDEIQWLDGICWTPQQVMRDYAWCKGVL